MEKLNVLIVGAGMYVCGKGTDEFGTILPTIIQLQKGNKINQIHVASRTMISIEECKKRVNNINKLFDYNSRIKYYPENTNIDENAFLKAAKLVKKPACAIIATPDHLHYYITDQLLGMNFHCLVVKPLTPTVSQALKLVNKAEKNSIWNGVEFHKRFDAANILLRRTINEEIIGELNYFVVEFSQRRSIPLKQFKNWINNTNVFQYLGVHYVDMIYYITNALPIRVSATGQKHLLIKQNIENYDAIQANIEWENSNGTRFNSIILTNWIDSDKSSAMSDQKIKVIGTKGRYESDQKNRGVQLVAEQKAEDINPYFSKMYLMRDNTYQIEGYGPDSIRQFIEDTKKYLSGKRFKTEVASFQEALISTAVSEAVLESLKSDSKWVNINIPKYL